MKKQTKTIEEQGKEQAEALEGKNKKLKSVEGLFPKKMINDKIKTKIDGIKEWEEKIKLKDLIYKANKI